MMKKNISVKDLQKIIRVWRSRRISDANIPKLLELYLGITAYMNPEREYPIENFYEIAVGLRFRTVRQLIEMVKSCGSFTLIPDEENMYGLKGFFSPFIREEEEGDLSTKMPCKTQANLQEGSIYNNYNYISSGGPSGRNKKNPERFFISCSESETPEPEGSAPAVRTDDPDCRELEHRSLADATAEGKAFFHTINITPSQKEQYLLPLIDLFMQREDISRKQACDNLVILVNELLIPHFASQERFLQMKHYGRLCWLKNLMKTVHGTRLIEQAALMGHQRRKKAASEEIKRRRENRKLHRPICEHEWMDEETGIRFYEDSIEGSVEIPREAPPRPSGLAIWNVLSAEWR